MLNIKNAYIYNSSFEELLKELKEINKNLIQKRVNLFKKELNKLKYKIVDYWLYCWDYLLINLIKLDEKPRIYIFPFEGKIYCKLMKNIMKDIEYGIWYILNLGIQKIIDLCLNSCLIYKLCQN